MVLTDFNYKALNDSTLSSKLKHTCCRHCFIWLQLQNIAEFIQTFVMLVDNPENQLVRTSPFILCQHMRPQLQCRVLPDCPFPCPSPEDIKYRMVRLSLDSIDLFMVEAGSALNLSVSGFFFWGVWF